MIMPVHRTSRATAARMRHPRSDTLSIFASVSPVAIAAEVSNWRPIGHRGGRRGVIERLEVAGAIHDTAANHGQIAGDVGDLTFGAGEEVSIWHDKIGKLTDLDAALLTLLI